MDSERTFVINNIEQTEKLAELLSHLLEPGHTILLTGDLGAGKTTLTQGVGKFLGVKRHMTSPTFNIIKSYHSHVKDCTVHHMDCYRLEDSDDDLGFDEYFNDESINIVEWPQFIEEYWPDEHLDINIEYIDETRRKVTVGATPSMSHIVEELYEKFND